MINFEKSLEHMYECLKQEPKVIEFIDEKQFLEFLQGLCVYFSGGENRKKLNDILKDHLNEKAYDLFELGYNLLQKNEYQLTKFEFDIEKRTIKFNYEPAHEKIIKDYKEYKEEQEFLENKISFESIVEKEYSRRRLVNPSEEEYELSHKEAINKELEFSKKSDQSIGLAGWVKKIFGCSRSQKVASLSTEEKSFPRANFQEATSSFSYESSFTKREEHKDMFSSSQSIR